MITKPVLLGREQSTAFIAEERLSPRGALDRHIRARDLIEFGRSPWRWRHAADADDPLLDGGPNLTEWLALDPEQAHALFVRRPDTYEAMRLECPQCHSPGPALTCTKCGTRRKHIVVPRPWNSAAKFCAAWVEKAEKANHRIIAAGEWDRATLGAKNILDDKAVTDLLPSALHLRVLDGLWHDEPTGLEFPIWARASLVPSSENAKYQVLAQIVETRNADPTVWESNTFNVGGHIRAALALLLYNALDQAPVKEFLWIAVERDAPRIVARRRASPELLQEGRTRLLELLAAYARCLQTGQWPRFEPEADPGLDAWPMVALEPWMTSGYGPHGGYFAPTAVPQPQGLALADAPPA